MRASVLILTFAAVLSACKGEPPTTVEGWAAQIPEIRDEKELAAAADSLRKLALEKLRAGEDLTAAVPALTPLLKEGPVVVQEVAYILGEIGDAGATDALVSAIDYAAAVMDKEASRSNGRVAEALGKIGDHRATRPLLKLTRSRDSFTALQAVQALGEIGDPAALDDLMTLATSDTIDPFISKNAIIALGKIGDATAMPALIKMLFMERKGVSFYRESSFAIFQVGADATGDLVDIIAGKNKDLLAWAEEKGVFEAALFAKTAQVLGDLSDRRAIPVLIRRLKYESEYADMRLLPRMYSAEALGRIRAKEAVGPISALLDEEEANARGAYTRSLVMIGDVRAVPALVKASTTGFGYDAREESLWGVAKLGGAAHLKAFDASVSANTNLRTCTQWFEGDKEAIAGECKKRIEKFEKRAEKNRPMLVAAVECKGKTECWLGKLSDEDGDVREKAAWELGRIGDPKTLEPVLAAVQDDDLEARFAMLHAIDALLFGANDREPEEAVAKKVVERLDGILTEEAGKAHTLKINEDTKRLALKVEKHLRDRAKREG